MKKRLTFQCGKCARAFSFTKELTGEQELIFSCPYCGVELVLKLEPFKRKKIETVKKVYRGENPPDEWEYVFPEVVPLEPRDPHS